MTGLSHYGVLGHFGIIILINMKNGGIIELHRVIIELNGGIIHKNYLFRYEYYIVSTNSGPADFPGPPYDE